MQVAALEQLLAKSLGGIVGVGQKCVLNDHRRPATGLEHLDEVLEEEDGGLAGLDGKVLLDLLAFLAAEGWIGEDERSRCWMSARFSVSVLV